MKELILVSDTHLGLYKSSDIWHNATVNLFREIVDLCLSRDILTIYHLGDFFHEKKYTNQKTLDCAYAIADVIKSLEMIVITGNHDVYYKEGTQPSSLKCFCNTPNIRVISETITLSNTILVPWKCKIPTKGLFCFGHFDINEFPMNSSSSICKEGSLNKDMFKGYKQVYSGHFHTPSQKDNITYIGSAFQQSFNDCDSSRGYYIWKEGDIEFIEFKDAPKFIRISTEDELKNIEGNIVKLIYAKDYGTNGNTKILEEVERANPLRLTVDFTNISTNEEKKVTDSDVFLVKHKDIIKEWIEKDKNIPVNLNSKILLKMMERMMEGE